MKSAFFFVSNKSLFLSVLLISSSFESSTKCVLAGRSSNGRTFSPSSNKYNVLGEVNAGLIPGKNLSAEEEAITDSDSLLSKLLNKPSKTLQALVQSMSFQNYKYKKLIQSLSKQLIDLQRQIRLHKEEIKQLRTLLQNQKDAKRKRRSKVKAPAALPQQEEQQKEQEEDEVLTKGQIKQYQNEIQQLNVQIEKLLSIQDELEVLLSKEREKLSQLETENAKYKRDITTLQHRITELQLLQKDTLDLVKVEREYYKKQIELVQQEVEKEKKKGLKAVEEEKQKMRKLVKALAAKEKEEKKKSKKG